ncbi:acyl-CoA dehydrogenase [Nocardiopsis gilva YIM 90087]|uniref:Acyl-CoA dehydrogenase n=1 Tax=Nocardiopsis gilva YIM 90087 TaxID=1235441 RepID=A0A223S007_9ACTN|nr:acyl-CoA dehydrogenase family protein [Nocardiopsis gilva]ASU81456.1 acyl-CoA dehydrogenase [Nocardiopsis gilva YIM 90087]
MDFEWSEEDNEAYERIRVGAEALTTGPDEYFTRDEWKRCAELGITGLCVPVASGGGGLGFLSTARATEALGRGCSDMGLVFGVLAHLFACSMPIVEFSGPELRERALPRLASGEWIGANAITEEAAGSDVMAMAARARRLGEHYVLDGVKSFVSNGPVADLFLVYAVTDPAMGHMGVSAFAVERDTPGLVAEGPFAKTGLRRCPAGAVRLENCRVPASHRLGEEGQGGAIFQRSMSWERTCLFAAYLGQTERLLERCVARARERRQFGRAIGSNQAMSHRIAEMRVRLEACKLLLWRACWLLDQGRPARLEVAVAKHEIAEGAVRGALDAMRIFAGEGVRAESDVGRGLDDALPALFFSGTSEMQLEMIAKELGL